MCVYHVLGSGTVNRLTVVPGSDPLRAVQCCFYICVLLKTLFDFLSRLVKLSSTVGLSILLRIAQNYHNIQLVNKNSPCIYFNGLVT